jgi:hypothetical protein
VVNLTKKKKRSAVCFAFNTSQKLRSDKLPNKSAAENISWAIQVVLEIGRRLAPPLTGKVPLPSRKVRTS